MSLSDGGYCRRCGNHTYATDMRWLKSFAYEHQNYTKESVIWICWPCRPRTQPSDIEDIGGDPNFHLTAWDIAWERWHYRQEEAHSCFPSELFPADNILNPIFSQPADYLLRFQFGRAGWNCWIDISSDEIEYIPSRDHTKEHTNTQEPDQNEHSSCSGDQF